MLALALTVSFWCACLLLLVGLARRARLWRNGRAAPVVWSGLLAVPKRYLVDLHHVVAREPFVANSHAAVAGGAVLAIAVIGLNYGLAPSAPRWRPGWRPAAGWPRPPSSSRCCCSAPPSWRWASAWAGR